MKSLSMFIRLILVTLILSFGAISIVATGGGGGGGGDSQNGDSNGNGGTDSLEVKSLFTAPDPEDSLLSRIEYEPDNTEGIQAIEIYQSTDNSDSERMTTQVYVAGESRPYMFYHDDIGRVERIDAPDGTGVKLDYTDNAVFFNYITPDKQIGAGSVTIEGELKELLDKLVNYDTSTSDVWISDTKALSMDEGNDVGDMTIQSTKYPLKYSLGMWAAVTLVNETDNLRGIPVDGANISCPNTKGYSCHLITVRDGGLREELDGTAYRDSFVEIVVRKEVIITADDVIDLRDDCESQNKISRDQHSKLGWGVGGAGFVALGCTLVPGFNVAFWGGVGAVSTTAGFGIANIESDLVPDCNPYADRQAALQKIPDDELEITITPYSHVYDIVSNPIKIKVKPSCMEYGLNCGDYNEYKEYSFTGAVHKGMSGAIIACDVCETGFIELNAHLESPASMPEALEFQAFNEEAVPTSLYWAAPGDENTCSGGDAPETEQYFLVKRSGTGYRKMWSGWAEKRTGYDYQYWYILPKDFNKKLAEANKFAEFTDNACWWEDSEGNQRPTSNALCPCVTYPDIWEDGKVELVGMFETWEEMDPYRCDTYQFDPFNIICTQWEVDSDPKYWNNINSICGY